MKFRDWKTAFPDLASIADPVIADALDASAMVSMAAGDHVFHAGSACEAYLLVASGDVRVQMVTQAGRTATLYHVRDGNSCVLTTACLLGQTAYPAEAIVENPTVALAMPKHSFDEAMNGSAAMRQFVFANLGQRFAEVIGRFEEIVFSSIDQRLARVLLKRDGHGALNVTHEELATETGTVREVISRHLKQFAARGWLRLGRGKVEIADRKALKNLAGGGS